MVVETYIFLYLFCSAGWVLTKCVKTIKILNNTLDSSVIDFFESEKSNKTVNESAYILPEVKDLKGIRNSLSSIRFMYARRLMAVSQGDDRYMRLRAVEHLAKLHLDDWQYALIGHMSDSRTSIGIARTAACSGSAIFLPPIRKYQTYNDSVFMHLLKDYLISLGSGDPHHVCIRKAISRVFMDSDVSASNKNLFLIHL